MLPLLAAAVLAPQETRLNDTYDKQEVDIPMRDGVRLHTVIYSPKAAAGKHPILMERTPYSAGPYGPGRYGWFSGSRKFRENGYIFVFQDVRGQYRSEGTFQNVTPQLRRGQKGTDESTDTWDTVDWLVKNVPSNNGAVGLWGISYPGFYAAAGGINTHPALKAISPQAPVNDWFLGDDVHHNGAFFIQDNFDFSAWFDFPRKGIEEEHQGLNVDRGGLPAYDFFLKYGTAKGIDDAFFKGQIPFWREIMDHPNYDAYWKDRALGRHFDNVKCAVLTVGGWFDAEDMWGALNLYRASERKNRKTPNYLVMGPWFHGMWASPGGRTFGDLDFGSNTSGYFQENVEFPFFERYLRGQAIPEPAEATVFQTGANKWRTFAQWPPKGLQGWDLYLGKDRALSASKPGAEAPDTYVNDPAAPTPYVADYKTSRQRPATYMIDDQRWAEERSDVLTYRGEALSEETTVAGPIEVDLRVATTGTDADFVVKVIDEWPKDAGEKSPRGTTMAGYQQLVRADVMRGRFRDSFERPRPFVPGRPTRVRFRLNDLLHTFRKGHRVVVQIQSSWFPLVDRNPNQFVDTYRTRPDQFQRATITVFHDAKNPSRLRFGRLR